MRVCLFEDRDAVDLEPLSLTRPVFELLFGLTSLASKQSRFFPPGPRGFLVRPYLADICRLHSPDIPVNDLAWLRSGPTILVNGRWLPPAKPLARAHLSEPGLAQTDGEIAFAVVEAEDLAHLSADGLDEWLSSLKRALPSRPAGGRLLRYPWELVQLNAEQIVADWQSTGPSFEVEHGPERSGIAISGPSQRFVVHATAYLDPMIVADVREGPVIIDRDAVVTAFTRLEGPCYIGPGSHVHRANIRRGTTIGPDCRIGGEISCSIVQGHSNKYHEGFLGHSYLGEWVNLGAGTNNSDLRNDYGEVTMTVNGRRRNTGLTKIGCFLGDHTKTGLGTLLNTGTNAGVFCNLLPGGLLPKYVPSFASWWKEELVDRADLSGLLHTASVVMQRRRVEFTPAHEALYRAVFQQTAGERRRVIHEAAKRELRRSA